MVISIHKIKSTFEQVSFLVQEIKLIAIKAGMGSVDSERFELGLAEALNNVVEHAYKMLSHNEINVKITRADRQLTVEITDTGVPMTTDFILPTRDGLAIENRELENLPDGGWGIEIIKKTMDSFSYMHTKSGVNRMILVKKFNNEN